MHQESFSALGTSVSPQTECVMDTETAPLEQMKLSVQVKVQIIIQNLIVSVVSLIHFCHPA